MSSVGVISEIWLEETSMAYAREPHERHAGRLGFVEASGDIYYVQSRVLDPRPLSQL